MQDVDASPVPFGTPVSFDHVACRVWTMNPPVFRPLAYRPSGKSAGVGVGAKLAMPLEDCVHSRNIPLGFKLGKVDIISTVGSIHVNNPDIAFRVGNPVLGAGVVIGHMKRRIGELHKVRTGTTMRNCTTVLVTQIAVPDTRTDCVSIIEVLPEHVRL